MLLTVDFSRVKAALEDRIKFLAKKFPSVPEASIRFLSTCDPSGGKYLEYLVTQRAKGILISEEGRFKDGVCWMVREALGFYMTVTKSKKIKEHLREVLSLPDIPNEISRINFKELWQLSENNYDNVKKELNRYGKSKGHAKVVYQDNRYKIITWDTSTNWDDVVDEICAYGKGKWCTQYKENVADYLRDGPFYIVFENGKSLLQTNTVQFKDITNHNFDFSEYMDLALILIKLKIIRLSMLDDLFMYHNLYYKKSPVYEYLKENRLI